MNQFHQNQLYRLTNINADLRKKLSAAQTGYLTMSAVALVGWICFVTALCFI